MIPPRTFKAALGQTTASYPVPFLAITFCGSALLILVVAGLAFSTMPGPLWALIGLAAVLFLFAILLVGYAALVKPALLRSDRTIIMQGAIQIFGDDEIGDLAKEHVGRAVETYLTHPGTARPDMLPGKNSLSLGEDDGDDDV